MSSLAVDALSSVFVSRSASRSAFADSFSPSNLESLVRFSAESRMVVSVGLGIFLLGLSLRHFLIQISYQEVHHCHHPHAVLALFRVRPKRLGGWRRRLIASLYEDCNSSASNATRCSGGWCSAAAVHRNPILSGQLCFWRSLVQLGIVKF